MKYLLVVAHPDDEVLGAGGTIYKLSHTGNDVDVCIMSTQAKARSFRPQDSQLYADMERCFDFLEIGQRYNGSFPNIEFNNVPHINLVQFIEQAIIASQPDIIITHHPADTNNDHLHTSIACQAAIRLFQRRDDIKPIKQFWFMEVLSSTEWNINSSLNNFVPNTYIELNHDGVQAKIDALAMYRGVMRDYPHPRSEKSIEALAAYRGTEVGLDYAEAFQCVLNRIIL